MPVYRLVYQLHLETSLQAEQLCTSATWNLKEAHLWSTMPSIFTRLNSTAFNPNAAQSQHAAMKMYRYLLITQKRLCFHKLIRGVGGRQVVLIVDVV